MKAITIQEPYASLIRKGLKHIETRSWKTNYRGEILIHAGAKIYPNTPSELDISDVKCGVIHCKATLVDCIEMTEEWIEKVPINERKLGFYTPGRYAWVLENIEPFNVDEQPTIKGKLGMWNY